LPPEVGGDALPVLAVRREGGADQDEHGHQQGGPPRPPRPVPVARVQVPGPPPAGTVPGARPAPRARTAPRPPVVPPVGEARRLPGAGPPGSAPPLLVHAGHARRHGRRAASPGRGDHTYSRRSTSERTRGATLSGQRVLERVFAVRPFRFRFRERLPRRVSGQFAAGRPAPAAAPEPGAVPFPFGPCCP